MQQPQAIIFDLDGVLTDTSEYHYRAWKRLADDEGIPFTREENDAHLRGIGRREGCGFGAIRMFLEFALLLINRREHDQPMKLF